MLYYDQLRPFPHRPPIHLLCRGSRGSGKNPAHRPGRLHSELPAGDGVRGQVDVLGGQRAGQALAGYPGKPDERRGVPGDCGEGPVEADGPHPPHGQRRRPRGQGADPAPGGVVSGEPVHIPGLRGLLLRNRLSGGAV